MEWWRTEGRRQTWQRAQKTSFPPQDNFNTAFYFDTPEKMEIWEENETKLCQLNQLSKTPMGTLTHTHTHTRTHAHKEKAQVLHHCSSSVEQWLDTLFSPLISMKVNKMCNVWPMCGQGPQQLGSARSFWKQMSVGCVTSQFQTHPHTHTKTCMLTTIDCPNMYKESKGYEKVSVKERSFV